MMATRRHPSRDSLVDWVWVYSRRASTKFYSRSREKKKEGSWTHFPLKSYHPTTPRVGWLAGFFRLVPLAAIAIGPTLKLDSAWSYLLPVTSALTLASSIPSSSGLITLPQTSHGFPGPSLHLRIRFLLFTNFPTKPPHYMVLPCAHPLLESAAFIRDLIENPITIVVNNSTISRRLLVEQATNSPCPFLSITSTLLPWTIHVRASNGSYVTLDDLFDAIYHSLRTNITTNEFISFHQTDQKRAKKGYFYRYYYLETSKLSVY